MTPSISPADIESLRKLLVSEQLPAMPNSAMNILKLGNDPTRVNINDIIRPIEADAGLAAQVLRFFNSSYFGFRSEISSVRQGIALVGIRVVKNFVLWKAVFSLIPKATAPHFRVTDLWQDSLRRAMFSRFMSMELKLGDSDVAFAGTLLSDMAIPLLLRRLPDEYGAVLEEVFASPSFPRLSTIERSRFGWTHADAAIVLADIWNLPEMLHKIVASHGEVELLADGAVTEIIEQQIAVVAALLPMTFRAEWRERGEFLDLLSALTGDRDVAIEPLFAKIDKEYEQYAAILTLPIPQRTLIEYFAAE